MQGMGRGYETQGRICGRPERDSLSRKHTFVAGKLAGKRWRRANQCERRKGSRRICEPRPQGQGQTEGEISGLRRQQGKSATGLDLYGEGITSGNGIAGKSRCLSETATQGNGMGQGKQDLEIEGGEMM